MAEQKIISLFDDDACTRYTILIASTIGEMREKKESIIDNTDPEIVKYLSQLLDVFRENFDTWAMAVVNRTGCALDPSTPKDQVEVKKFRQFSETEKSDCFIKCLLLLILSLGNYSPYSRNLLYSIAEKLGLSSIVVYKAELITSSMLLDTFQTMESNQEMYELSGTRKMRRRIAMGLAGLAGGALIGLTGGLAAPFVAAGLGTLFAGLGLGTMIGATYLGTLITSAPMITALFGGFGAKMSMQQMGDVSKGLTDFEFIPLSVQSHLPVTIGISGWLGDYNEVDAAWKSLTVGDKSYYWGDIYALKFEVEALVDLGKSLSRILFSAGLGWVKGEVISRTILAPLAAALWPLSLLKVGNILGNSWRIAFNLSIKAGEALANALCVRAQGMRPVTLIGFSLGARTILECLLHLADRGETNLVENVIVMGAPMPTDAKLWLKMRCVVAGRFVNVYSASDYVLQLVYRVNSAQSTAAGLGPVSLDSNTLENVDVGDLVEGHLQYRWLVAKILKERLGYDNISDAEIQSLAVQEEKYESKQRTYYSQKEQEEEIEQEVLFDASSDTELAIQKKEDEVNEVRENKK